jgi:3-hydroxybutyryl-CoA dehydrogenase
MGVGTVAVVGCGMMGRGIMEVAAAAGLKVRGIKVTPGDLAEPKKLIQQSLERRVKKGKLTAEQSFEILARIELSTGLAAVQGAELVVESAVEDEYTKIKLLKDIEARMHPEAVLGTNTSSLRLETLAAALTRPERFVGLHFFSPVPAMDLVELSAIAKTADYAAAKAEAFCKQIGKTPVRVQASPGYVVNRLLVPYLLHGISTLESGIASADAIDSAMKLGCGHPLGPLALADLIGLDVVRAMAETLQRELGDRRYDMPATLLQLTDANQLGRKTKIGIFDYSGEKNGEAPTLNAALKFGA